MDIAHAFLFSGGLILFLTTGIWLLSLYLDDSSIADIFWGAGFVLITLAAYLFSERSTLQTLLAVLVTVWGGRLTAHIFLRNHGKPEDPRYAAWRRQAGRRWWWYSYFKVFLVQGFLMWAIAAPLLAVQAAVGVRMAPIEAGAGAAIWAIGFFFEAAGDYQLARFKANPRNAGRVLTVGVWRYTRHPNYFGDAAQWWGFYVLAVSAGGWWTVYSPLIMTLLLLRVSGVTLLEKSMKARPGYEDYVKTTSSFFPWFPARR
jgi:steroid 5-alpha reductase family enzyme